MFLVLAAKRQERHCLVAMCASVQGWIQVSREDPFQSSSSELSLEVFEERSPVRVAALDK